jgi:uncharacterized DUF497 family protein
VIFHRKSLTTKHTKAVVGHDRRARRGPLPTTNQSTCAVAHERRRISQANDRLSNDRLVKRQHARYTAPSRTQPIKITDVIWFPQFVEKIERKHGLSPEEVESALAACRRIQRIERGTVRGEHVYRALGQTEAGRYIAVFFIDKGAGRALVISARDMSPKERKHYGRQ